MKEKRSEKTTAYATKEERETRLKSVKARQGPLSKDRWEHLFKKELKVSCHASICLLFSDYPVTDGLWRRHGGFERLPRFKTIAIPLQMRILFLPGVLGEPHAQVSQYTTGSNIGEGESPVNEEEVLVGFLVLILFVFLSDPCRQLLESAVDFYDVVGRSSLSRARSVVSRRTFRDRLARPNRRARGLDGWQGRSAHGVPRRQMVPPCCQC